MRPKLLACCALVAIALSGCKAESGAEPDSLSVSPSGTVNVAGPTVFAATVTGGAGVTWSLSGPGSLSGTSGLHVTYRPAAAPGVGQTADLTAHAGSMQVAIHLVISPVPVGGPGPTTIPSLSADVEVLYDAWDVPHVSCAIDLDCFAVQGYLHARDRLFQADFLRRVARGHLAELVGPLGLEQDVQLRTLFTMRDGGRLEDAVAAALDAATRARVEAYVAGINARLAELTDADLPGEYLQLPVPVHAADIPAWEVEDVTGLARLQQFQLSESIESEADYGRFALAYGPGAPLFGAGGKFSTWVRTQLPVQARVYTLVPPGGSPPAPLRPSVPTSQALAPWSAGLSALSARMGALHQALRTRLGEAGSNNWVVDAAHSESGFAMVANDPHLDLPYPPNFYLAALTSNRASDNLDITGGSFPGTPGALVGRGKNVGWGVTVVGYDVTDLYREQFLPGATCTGAVGTPYCVLYRGAPVALVVSPQAYQFRGPDGALHDAVGAGILTAQQAAVFVVPHHGPIIQAPDSGGHAVSVRWTGHEGWTADLKAFLHLGTATDVDDAIAGLADYATGAQNFVLADDQGHIAYDPHALVPIRDFADPRVVGASVQPPWFPLPGDGTAEWGHAADLAACSGVAAPRTCFLPDDQLPQGKDPAWGFFVTANSDPLGISDGNFPFPHAPYASYPSYLSFDWDEIGFREARITERLAALTDAGKVAEVAMEEIQADHVSTLGRAFFGILTSDPAYDAAASTSPDFAAAMGMLTAWSLGAPAFDCPTGLTGPDPGSLPLNDANATANSAGCLLFHAFLRDLLHRVFADDLAVAGLGVDSGNALKGMLHMLEPGVPADDTSFCDDVDASGALVRSHACSEQVVAALTDAYQTLIASSDFLWGRVHTFTSSSLFPTVTLGYTAGPFARPGGALTVDVGNPSITPGPSFAFGSSGNVRHVSVMDPAAPTVRMQLPGAERDGPRGVVAGPDLLGMWIANTYFDYANWQQIQSTAVGTQTFSP